MGLFDVIDEMTEKQILKTDTGDNRIFGVMLGIVAKNYDKSMPGRVCVTIPVRDKNANELQWARVAMPSSGKGWGHYFLPEIGDQVLLAFEQGNIEKPIVIGCVPKDANTFLTKAVDEQNQYKKIITKHGSSLIFEDNKEDDSGEKDKIQLYTAGKQHEMSLDNEHHTITITDKEKKNQITMDTEKGKMMVKAEQRLEIQVGDSIKLVMNGANGSVQLECTKLTVKADNSVHAESNGTARLKGGSVTIEAASTLKAESSGTVRVSGTPIQLG